MSGKTEMQAAAETQAPEVKPGESAAVVTEKEAAAPEAAAATPSLEAPKEQAAPKTLLTGEPEKDAAAEAPQKTSQAPELVVPEKYELKIPEGSLLNSERIAQIEASAKEQKLTNAEAQELIDWEHGAVSAWAEQLKAEQKAETERWAKEAEKDPEIGGLKFKENLTHANRVIQKFGSDAFRKALNESGLGNHPELVRIFARIGQAMKDDVAVIAGEKAPVERPIYDVFYPNMKKTN